MSYKMLAYFAFFISIGYLVYQLFPKKHKYLVLLFFSYLFYIFSNGWLTIFLIVTTLSIYLIALWINKVNDEFKAKKEELSKEERKEFKKVIGKKKKKILVLGIIFNLLFLIVLKYLNFILGSIGSLASLCGLQLNIKILPLLMPLGISFYTLEAISYIVDVYRGKYEAEKNFFKIALFLGFYPALIEGPISRYDEFGQDITAPHEFNYKNMCHGLQLIVWGLIKKIVMADRMNIIVSAVFSNYKEYSGIVIVFAVIVYTFQIYTEFSGIIDIVTGILEMYGIKATENFKRPLFSRNVDEFWRRWHMSLGAWMRDYIFYSISFSKPISNLQKKLKGKVSSFLEGFLPIAVSLFFVWLCNGLWHGASFKYIFYGLYYYVIMMIGQLIKPKKPLDNKYIKVLQIIRTFILVNIGMLIFRADTIQTSFKMLISIFQSGKVNLVRAEVIDIYDLSLIFISIFTVLIVDFIQEKGIKIREYIDSKPVVFRWAVYILAIFAVIIFGAYGDGYVPVDPIYGQF